MRASSSTGTHHGGAETTAEGVTGWGEELQADRKIGEYLHS